MGDPRCIWVCGPQGAGKTTLIEGLLRSNQVRELVAIRLHRREDAACIVVNWEGLFESEDEEIRRIEYAGAAYPVVKATFPPSSWLDLPEHLADSFQSLEYVDGVLFEGSVERSLQRDLVVLVTRPLSADETLVSRGTRVVDHVELEGEGLELPECSLLPEDEEVARDVLDYASTCRPPSLYIADLADPRDAVTKKILARIKRCCPPVLTAAEEDW